jgi:hypothetical protein
MWTACGGSSDGKKKDEVAPAEKAPAALSGLAMEKQEYVWACEHAAFEIETRFGAPFVDALRAGDQAKLLAFFRPKFEGARMDAGATKTTDRGYLRQTRLDESPSATPIAVDPAGLLDHLKTYIDGFSNLQSIKIQVQKIDARDDDPSTGDWNATLIFKGGGYSAEGPREFFTLHRVQLHYAADEDLGTKPVIERWEVIQEVVRGSTQQLVVETTEGSGLEGLGVQDNWAVDAKLGREYSFQVAVDDYDRDGFLDIAVAAYNGRHLWRSIDGKRFEDVHELFPPVPQDFVKPRGYLVAFFDYDNDGWPDLLMHESLYRNDQGKRFVDVTPGSGLTFEPDPLGCAIADYDGDGLLDIYVANHAARTGKRGTDGWVGDEDSKDVENDLWRNLGDGKFEKVDVKAGVAGGKRRSFAAVWLHANGDRHPDLFIANEFGRNMLFHNKGDGTFDDVTTAAGIGDHAFTMGTAAGDIDNDGLPEIYAASMFSKVGRRVLAHVAESDYAPGVHQKLTSACAGNLFYKRSAESDTYDELSEEMGINRVGWAYAPSFTDMDNDGFLDLYATAGFMSFSRDKPDG